MNYLAIDPGASWVGIAELRYSPGQKKWVGLATVLDVRKKTFVDAMYNINLRIFSDAVVVVENYQVRSQGFNAFDGGRTLRMLGAIQWMCHDVSAVYHEVPPNSPTFALKLWPNVDPSFFVSKHGDHAMSAWRILGAYFLKTDPAFNLKFDGTPL